MKTITIQNFGELGVGTFLLIYENEVPVDSGVILEIEKGKKNTLTFKSASKKDEPKLLLGTDKDTDIWFPVFEDLDHELCFSRRGPFYKLVESQRRIPLRLS